ncbi:hypothetical protein ACXET9_07425 [Brachybacterium sp. DNPG3]
MRDIQTTVTMRQHSWWARVSVEGSMMRAMDMREEHAIWARQIRQEIDQRQQTLDLRTPRRVPVVDDGRQAAAGEECQDPGGWDAA